MAPSQTIHGTGLQISDDAVLSALGDALGRIKRRDNLTYDDIGKALGRGADAATLYARGNADMPLTVFVRGTRAWGSDFADSALAAAGGRLCHNAVSAEAPLTVASGLSRITAMLIDAGNPNSPGGVNMHPTELLPIADAATTLMPMLAAIIAEAARLRS